MAVYLNDKGINMYIDTDLKTSKRLIERTITDIYDNTVESIGRYCFGYCESMTRAEFPRVTTVAQNGFANCPELVEVILPKVKQIKGLTFFNDVKLKKVDLGELENIEAGTFNSCAALDTLILRKADGICTLAAVNSLNGTPFGTGGAGGTIYCPASLIAEYQAETNWQALYEGGTCNFVAIEGSEYE